MSIHSLLSRRSSGLVTIICVITFCCIYLTTHVVKSIHNVKIVYKTARETPLKDKLKLILNCCDQELKMETLQYGQYWLIKNYIRGRLSINMECAQSITYTTNSDYTYLGNLIQVVERWLAPISVAIFAPGYDYNATMDSIQYIRNCLPSSSLIRDYISFHIYFPVDHFPAYIATNEELALEWPYDCELKNAPYEHVKRSNMYKTQTNLTYPVNVGRNIARKAANTYFILASDIELYPSLGLVDQFLELINRNHTNILNEDKPKVFPLPVFELKENSKLPNSKQELQKMLNFTQAVPFHFNICKSCHKIPRYYDWITAKPIKELQVFEIAKRYDLFLSWEPFYISDNKEPLFDERFSWEGKSDKRIQNYAMCLKNYEYHVLHPAFLVHTPGIKELNPDSNDNKQRKPHVEYINQMINDKIKSEYLLLYGNNTRCGI